MVDHKGRVDGVFNNFAGSYDDIVGMSMASFTNLLLRDLQIPENSMVLDVGCGTGISTFELMKKVQGRGKFYGIDISQKMINLARARAADLGYSNVEFSKGDAERLDFPDSIFDLIFCNQTLLFVSNKQKALNEMFRVLKPMGQTALLFYGEQTAREIEEIYDRIRSRHPEYGMPEFWKLIGLEETLELFDKAGFRKNRIFGMHQIDYIDISKYCAYIDAPTAFWRMNMSSDLSPELIETVRREIREEATKAKTDKGFKITIYNIIAYAQKT
jgi:ubiquinone/menaquinone biosynthesis C-methylase UbiE